MLVLAVTLHNIPEGMAVGVVFAGLLSENALISGAGALALSIGIAIQNFPEGAIISMPLKSEGMGRFRSFLYGTASGIVEPIAALLTILLTGIITPALPYLLSFAAGAMIYVVVEELIPESQAGAHSNIGTIGGCRWICAYDDFRCGTWLEKEWKKVQTFAYETTENGARILRCFSCDKRVEIPERLEGLIVREIGDYAFSVHFDEAAFKLGQARGVSGLHRGVLVETCRLKEKRWRK